MGFLTSMIERRWAVQAGIAYPGKPPSDPSLAAWFGVTDSAAGVTVTPWTALNASAVWAATNVISSAYGMLTPVLYRRRGKAGREPAEDHPVYSLLHDEPCPDVAPFSFQQALQAHALTWGNGYAVIRRDGAARPVALWPITPNRVRPDRDARGLFYRVQDSEGGPPQDVRAVDMLHLPGLGFDGICGYSVIHMARESLGLTMASERFGSAFFGNGSWAGGWLKAKNKLADKTKRELRDSIERAHQGPNWAHKLGILDGGLEWQQVTIPPEDAQFLETRQFQTVECARWFNLPPHLLRDLTRATFANIEQQSLEFVVFTLGPWLCRWEQEIRRKLLTPEERRQYLVDHDVTPLLRGDAKSRWEVYQIGRQNGVLNADEIRGKEGWNEIEDGAGKTYYVNSAMVPVTAPAEPEEEDEALAQGEPGAELLAVPDVRQREGWDCGPAAAHAAAATFGAGPDDPDEWVQLCRATPGAGARPPDLIAALVTQGLTVTSGGDMEVEDLTRFFKVGQPVICPVHPLGQAGHYLVVIGTGLGQVFVHDVAAGRRMIAAEDFLAQWQDTDADGQVYTRFGMAVGEEVPAATEEPEPDDDDDDDEARQAGQAGGLPSPAKGSGPGPRQAAALVVAQRAVFADALGRMVRREATAARRAAKKPKEFLAWIEAFYPEHEKLTAEAIVPAVRAHLALAGSDASPEEKADAIAAGMAEASCQQLLRVAGESTAAALEANVAVVCDRWELERAAQVADGLAREALVITLGTEQPHA